MIFKLNGQDNMTQNADSIKGIPFWDFGLLNDDQLDGLWDFVDLMPDHVQGALEEAKGQKTIKGIKTGDSKQAFDMLDKGVEILGRRGFRD